MNETVYFIGEFPGHEVLGKILDESPMPEKPGMKGAALMQDPLARYLRAVESILRDCGFPTTSMELDALIDLDIDDHNQIEELAMRFTMLLRLIHRTRSAWMDGELSKFGYYMGQLSKVTAEAKYYENIPYMISGKKSYIGGKKGAAKRTNTKVDKPTHIAIRQFCENLLELELKHIKKRDLAGVAHRQFSKREGFPKTIRQYRNIIGPLK